MSNIIELTGIKQTYDEGRVVVMNDLNFSIVDKPAQGQFAVILGMSGCGKSTLLRYIAGLQKPTEGKVMLQGKEVGPDNRASMVFQEYSSLPWMTVEENVALALQFKGIEYKERMIKAHEMINMVGLSGHEKKYAQYHTLSV
jgi:NitT/TauT family transport system ATP-binding protein